MRWSSAFKLARIRIAGARAMALKAPPITRDVTGSTPTPPQPVRRVGRSRRAGLVVGEHSLRLRAEALSILSPNGSAARSG